MFMTMGEVAVRGDLLGQALMGGVEAQLALVRIFDGVELYEHVLSWSEKDEGAVITVPVQVIKAALPHGYSMSLVISIVGPSDAASANELARKVAAASADELARKVA